MGDLLELMFKAHCELEDKLEELVEKVQDQDGLMTPEDEDELDALCAQMAIDPEEVIYEFRLVRYSVVS